MTDVPSTDAGESWSDTVLWKTYLKDCDKPDAAAVKLTLEHWMPKVESILQHGRTSPTDFTLHDPGHGFRVAQRMAEIMPDETLTGLGPYELAFLLMAAYLHDIGMTPERRKVTGHYHYLLTGQDDELSRDDIKEFQRWLDDDQEGVTPPLCSGQPTSDQLTLATRLTAHFCRARHNDWSAEWMRKHAPTGGLGAFLNWLDDLIRLCQSHHYGFAELNSDAFNPRPVGRSGQVLHLRYLACVLRVADVLELDPERTPHVILSHRNVDPASLIYWHKKGDSPPATAQSGGRRQIPGKRGKRPRR